MDTLGRVAKCIVYDIYAKNLKMKETCHVKGGKKSTRTFQMEKLAFAKLEVGISWASPGPERKPLENHRGREASGEFGEVERGQII